MENPTFTNPEILEIIKTERNLRNSVAVAILFNLIFRSRGSILMIISLVLYAWWVFAVYKSAKAQKKNAMLYVGLQVSPIIILLVSLLLAMLGTSALSLTLMIIGGILGIVSLVLTIRLIYNAISITKKAGLTRTFWGVKKEDIQKLESAPSA